jgi:hypothetical protein
MLAFLRSHPGSARLTVGLLAVVKVLLAFLPALGLGVFIFAILFPSLDKKYWALSVTLLFGPLYLLSRRIFRNLDKAILQIAQEEEDSADTN